jgi:hypothetical protein
MTALGGTVGASVAFGLSIYETTSTGVSNSVYGAFVGIMCFAIVSSTETRGENKD